MKLTQKNCMEFAEWDNKRSKATRLREAIRRLIKITEMYGEAKIPPQHAVLEDFSYRVFLLYFYTDKKHIAEQASGLTHDGDWIRYKTLYPDLQVYRGSDILQPCINRFERGLYELKKILVDELDKEANLGLHLKNDTL